jgi:hypothetical protein
MALVGEPGARAGTYVSAGGKIPIVPVEKVTTRNRG